MCERRGGMLSGYRMAPSAVENINPVWPFYHSLAGTGVHQIPMCFVQKEAGIFFYLKMISVNTKDSNCFHKSCPRVERIYMEWSCLVISRPIPNPAGK